MKHISFFLACTLSAAPALAEQVFAENVSVVGGLCAGNLCGAGEAYTNGFIKLKSTDNRIHFDDRSTSTIQDDWELRANDFGAGDSLFAIRNLTDNTSPLTLMGGAPDNALYVDEFGFVGLGTSLPLANLHLTAGFPVTMMFENTGAQPHQWNLQGSASDFGFIDIGESGTTQPVRFATGAPSFSLSMDSDGNIGLGTLAPAAPLEISDDATFSFFRLTATEAPTNQSVDVVFTQGPLGTGEFRYNIVDGDGPEMRLNANGDMVLDGTLTTGGPTCDTGCDAVFDAGFKRLSVTDHASLMWENGHLPAVGPTLPHAPMNVSEKMGGILNELEHAHIYIEELHAKTAAQDARLAVQAALLAEQQALTARLLARLEKLEQDG